MNVDERERDGILLSVRGYVSFACIRCIRLALKDIDTPRTPNACCSQLGIVLLSSATSSILQGSLSFFSHSEACNVRLFTRCSCPLIRGVSCGYELPVRVSTTKVSPVVGSFQIIVSPSILSLGFVSMVLTYRWDLRTGLINKGRGGGIISVLSGLLHLSGSELEEA